jgi:hypothetical protein
MFALLLLAACGPLHERIPMHPTEEKTPATIAADTSRCESFARRYTSKATNVGVFIAELGVTGLAGGFGGLQAAAGASSVVGDGWSKPETSENVYRDCMELNGYAR